MDVTVDGHGYRMVSLWMNAVLHHGMSVSYVCWHKNDTDSHRIKKSEWLSDERKKPDIHQFAICSKITFASTILFSRLFLSE
jgi:hypothetical protein